MSLRRRSEVGERPAVRDPELKLHDVEPCHLLGHGVLDLDAPIQLEEEHLVAFDEELGRPRALVPECGGKGDRVPGDALEESGREAGRGRLLDHLLVASLHRAVALAEREHSAVPVADQLHLDVARAREVALAVHGAVSERGLRLARGRLQRVGEVSRTLDDPHPAPAATRSSLDEQRVAEVVGIAHRKRRDARGSCDPLRLDLVAATAERLGRRADPGELGVDHCLREGGTLREEAVARVDELRVGFARGRHERVRVEVRRHLDRVVGDPRVERVRIARTDDGDRFDPEAAARREDADRDLAAVRHQEPASLVHRRRDTSAWDVASGRVANGGVLRTGRGRRPRPGFSLVTRARSQAALRRRARHHRRRARQPTGGEDAHSAPSSSARSTARFRSAPSANIANAASAYPLPRATYGQPASSTSSGTRPPTASAAVAAAIPERHHASQVRSAARRVRRVTSATSGSLIVSAG